MSDNLYSVYVNYGADITKVVSAVGGKVFSFSCHNTTASPRYFQLHNLAAVPTGTEVPRLSFLVPANSTVIVGNDFFGNEGVVFKTGISFAVSTTEATYTAATATDHMTQISYN